MTGNSAGPEDDPPEPVGGGGPNPETSARASLIIRSTSHRSSSTAIRETAGLRPSTTTTNTQRNPDADLAIVERRRHHLALEHPAEQIRTPQAARNDGRDRSRLVVVERTGNGERPALDIEDRRRIEPA